MKIKRYATYLFLAITPAALCGGIGAEEKPGYVFSAHPVHIRGEYQLYGPGSTLEQERVAWEKKASKKRNDAATYAYLAHVYYYMGDEYKSLHNALEAVRCGDTSADIFNLIAASYAEQKDYDRAQEYYLKTLEVDNANAQALLRLGLLAEAKENYEALERYAKAILELYGDYPGANALLGKVYFYRAEYDAAQKQFELELERNPDSAESRWYLGKIMEQNAQNIDGIIHAYYTALERAPFDKRIRVDLINAYTKKGAAYAGIVADEKRLLALEPLDSALYDYGTLLLESSDKKEWDKGVEALKKLAERYPQYPNVHNSIGAVLFKTGEYRSAEQNFAVEGLYNPNNARMWHNKARLHYTLWEARRDSDFLNRAQEYIAKCLLIDPLNTDIREVQEKVEQELRLLRGQ